MNKLNSGTIKNVLSIVDPNEPPPPFITVRPIYKAVVSLSPKTLANWRSYLRSPKY